MNSLGSEDVITTDIGNTRVLMLSDTCTVYDTSCS